MEFLTTVCMAAIASALFRMIVPENKAAKQVSLLIACVFLLTGISALSGAELDIDTDGYELEVSEDYVNISQNVNKSLQKKICKEMSDKAYDILHKNGYYPDEIHVIVNISGLYGIDITQVKLVFGEEGRGAAEAAAKLLAAELGDGIKVTAQIKG